MRASQEGVLRTAEDQMREEHRIQDKPREEIGTTRHNNDSGICLLDNVY